MTGLAALAWLAWPWLPIAPDATGTSKLAIIAIVVVIVVSFSPTMTAAVIAETGSRGKLSDFVLAMVVLADLIVLVLFSLAMQFARAAFSEGAPEDVNLLVRLAWEIGGALAFGSLVGAVFALYLRYVGREVTLALLVVALLLSQVGVSQRVEPLLAAMAAGIVIANVAVAQGETLKAAIRSGALPLLVVFFVAVGTSLRLDTLAAAGVAAIGLALARIGLIWIGARAGLRARERRRSRGRIRVDRSHLAGGHYAGPRGRCRDGVPHVGNAGADAAGCAHRHRRARRALRCSAPASCGRGKSTRTRRGRCSSSRTASRISTTSTIADASPARRPPAASPSRSMRSCASEVAHGSRTERETPIARRSMRETRYACPRTTRRTTCGDCGFLQATSPPITAGLRTRACGRSVIWSTCGRNSGPTTGPRTRR